MGRKKDIVIRGGENIACTEVEAALYQVSSGIREASVFSIPDDRLGETVGAALYAEADGRCCDAQWRVKDDIGEI